jgi:putative endonuclease
MTRYPPPKPTPPARTRPHPSRPSVRQSLGQRGEQLAVDALAGLGYDIVARNFRCQAGEIDVVTRLGGCWVFVEVRTRRSARFGSPEESITARKRAHLIAAAQTYLQQNAIDDVDWRIDLVAVEFNPKGQLVRIEIVENAVNLQ